MSKIMRRMIATVATAVGTAIVVGVLGVSFAGAATFTVTNTADSGPGSLRRAIADAGGTAGSDTIQFAPGVAGTITLTSGPITITSPVDVQGPGADAVTVSGHEQSRVFTVQAASTASMSGLTIADGVAASGGGIRNDGTLTLANVTVRNNGASGDQPTGRGGGIYNTGSLSLQRSIVRDNGASGDDALGGGIANDGGSVTVAQSTIRDNEATGTFPDGDGTGGGIANERGDLTIRSSTLSGNEATGDGVGFGFGSGGAVSNDGRNLVITNSTISGNGALGAGAGSAGVEDAGSGATTLTSDTIASNTARPLDDDRGANLTLAGAQTTIRNTIVANGGGGQNCFRARAITSGYDLEDANTCGFSAASDQRNTEPRLAPLEDNGGPTRTRSIPISSPATDQGISAGLNNDQRGKDRPSVFPDIPKPPGGDGSDIGAYELQAILATVMNTNDSGNGSLRSALAQGAIQINFAPGVTGTITLGAPLRIRNDTQILGPGAASLTVSGNDQNRVFEVDPGTTSTISGLTITKGRNQGDDSSAGHTGEAGAGGAILNDGRLTLQNALVTNSVARGGGGDASITTGGDGGPAWGGGILNRGTLTLSNTTVSGNKARGGDGDNAPFDGGNGGNALGAGIRNTGTLNLDHATLGGNTVEGGGGVNGTGSGGNGGDAYGGGLNNAGATTVSSSTAVTGNNAIGGSKINGSNGTADDGHGAGLYNNGTLLVQDSSITGNASTGGDTFGDPRGSATGGGVESASGDLTLRRVTVASNTAKAGGVGGSAGGGGVVVRSGQATITSSTVNGNQAVGGNSSGEIHGQNGRAGGIAVSGGSLAITNSTINGNLAKGGSGGGSGIGGGIDNFGSLTLTNVTLSSNDASSFGASSSFAGRNLFTNGGATSALTGTIVAGGGAAGCGGAVTSRGYNLEDANSCKLGQPTDITNKDAMLGPLQDNGGPTRTRAIPKASPAVDQGPKTALTEDQRGKTRPIVFGDIPKPTGGNGSDIGAYEVQRNETPQVTITPAELRFGKQPLNRLSDPQVAMITSAGLKDLRITDIRASGANRDDFILNSADVDACKAAPLAIGKSCTLRIRFGPSGVGPRAAALSITSNDPSSPDSIQLMGKGVSTRRGGPTCRGRAGTIVSTGSGPTYGTARDDVIVGSRRADVIRSRRGDDLACGRRGSDHLNGGRGSDRLHGGRGSDVCHGGRGDDVADASCERVISARTIGG